MAAKNRVLMHLLGWLLSDEGGNNFIIDIEES